MSTFGRIGLAILTTLIAGCAATSPVSRPLAEIAAMHLSAAPVTRDRSTPADPFLEQYAATYRFRLGRPHDFTVLPDGAGVFFLRSGPRDFKQALYLFDVPSGEEILIATSESLLGDDSTIELSEEEKARRERMRMATRGVSTYELSTDGRRLLVPLSAQLFVIEVGSWVVTQLDPGGAAIDPRFTPDANAVSYVIDGEIHMLDIRDRSRRQLTWTSDPEVTTGLAEFVAQEEMDRSEGYWWSPDGRYLAYQQTNTSNVGRMHIMDPTNPGGEPTSWPYPRPGERNADVRLFILDMLTEQRTEVAWNHRSYPYLARVIWPDRGPLTILVQNRRQTEEILLAVNAMSGGVRELLRETDDAWLNIDPQMPIWIAHGREFLWTTERNNGWQIERRRADGQLIAELTPRTHGYRGVAHVDEQAGEIWWTGSVDPTQRQINISLLNDPSLRLTPQRWTRASGLHDAEFSDDGSLYVHTAQTFYGEDETIVRRRDGQIVGRIQSVAERPPFNVNLELTTVTPTNGRTYHAAIIRPTDFNETARYPIILSVYGGPHAQTVQAHRSRYAFQQWLADNGFIVVSIDGRGTPNRGRLWEREIKGDFISKPLADQVEGLLTLGRDRPEMDLSRVGVYGWSFGGYFAAMAVMQRPDVFKAAVAGAPVADWMDYDTHYTERYLGLPTENPDGYATSNVLTHAPNLRRPLLLIHGTADDNVFFTHSLKISKALFDRGIDHEFLPLAGQTHMVTDPDAVVSMHERMLEFFKRRLGG